MLYPASQRTVNLHNIAMQGRRNTRRRVIEFDMDNEKVSETGIIGYINDLLKNKANIVHSRHRSIHNFIMGICAALTAWTSPKRCPYISKKTQLTLF